MLECGIGSADVPRYIKENDILIEYTGIDITKGFLEKAQKEFPQHTFIEASVEKLPFPDTSFEIVYARHLVEHLPYYEKAIYEMRRVAHRMILVLFRVTSDEDHLVWERDGYFDNYYGLPRMRDFLNTLFTSCEYHYILSKDEPYLNVVLDCVK
jgi:ubiquinone/menaquinone biosynthesis C-methylase UbiE